MTHGNVGVLSWFRFVFPSSVTQLRDVPSVCRYSPKSPSLVSETVHYKRGVSQQFSMPSFKIDFSEWKEEDVSNLIMATCASTPVFLRATLWSLSFSLKLNFDLDRGVFPMVIQAVVDEGDGRWQEQICSSTHNITDTFKSINLPWWSTSTRWLLFFSRLSWTRSCTFGSLWEGTFSGTGFLVCTAKHLEAIWFTSLSLSDLQHVDGSFSVKPLKQKQIVGFWTSFIWFFYFCTAACWLIRG